MRCEEYLTSLKDAYIPISVLSEKNGCRVLRMRNKTCDKDLVARCYPQPVAAYEELYRIACPHLPLIYDVVELEDGWIVLEEFIEGITVAEVMESGKYRYAGARAVIRAVCLAMEVLHQRNLVHRDIKPENIMIGKDGRVVLIDFNAARKVSAAKRDTVVMGTVGYASPEQLGVSKSDARADIYAVGVLLNVMLSGCHPSEKMVKGKAGRIVRRCTAVNPEERYQSAEKLAAAL
jgi:serine/threonine protein kinase